MADRIGVEARLSTLQRDHNSSYAGLHRMQDHTDSGLPRYSPTAHKNVKAPVLASKTGFRLKGSEKPP
jgi:hypothetical protein